MFSKMCLVFDFNILFVVVNNDDDDDDDDNLI